MKEYQSPEIKDLAEALAKAQAEMTHAKKEQTNPAFSNANRKASYADLSAVIDAARPHLAKHGLSVSQITDFEGDSISLLTQLTHSSGQWIRSWYPVKPTKQDPQGFGSALTYARRYSYAAIVGVAASGEDDDGNEASGIVTKEREYKGLFDTKESLVLFVKNCKEALEKCESHTAVTDQKTLNKAKWDALKGSEVPLEKEGWQHICAAYNAALTTHKPVEPEKLKTVDDAKSTVTTNQ